MENIDTKMEEHLTLHHHLYMAPDLQGQGIEALLMALTKICLLF